MAKAAKRQPRLELTDGLIQSLVFETFGLRRFTQDSPIRPDVWVKFLKLAKWRLADPGDPADPKSRSSVALNYRVPLILTPKQTMSRDGRPAGHAGQLAEHIRELILATHSPDRGYGSYVKRPQMPTFDAGDIIRKEEQRNLEPFRLAATSRNVAIDVTFSEMMDFVLPLTSWWTRQTYSNKARLSDDLSGQLERGATVRQALNDLDDTEFFRFAALSALTKGLLAHAITRKQFDTFCEVMAPIHMARTRISEEERELFPDLARSGEDGSPSGTKLKEIRVFWEIYRDQVSDGQSARMAGRTTGSGALSENQDEVAIWSVNLNRPTLRQVAPPLPAKPPKVSGRANLSSVTVKADAAKKLFGVKTSHLAWAVVDTGIDATHPAFQDEEASGKSKAIAVDAGSPEHPKSRIVATLDFTILQDVLAENEAQVNALLDRICGAGAAPDRRKEVERDLLKSLKAIRDENVSGRQLDWSLLERLIRIDPMAAPVPSDPHGTHVAGILGGGLLENGVGFDVDPFEGVCPDIRIFDLRVFANETAIPAADATSRDAMKSTSSQSGGDEFTVLAALDYVSWLNRDPMRPAIHGINLSLAIPFEVDSHACGRTPVCEACDRLVWNGTVVVAAAGNSGFDKEHKQAKLGVGYRGMTITDPGNAQEVITVGATHHSEPHSYGVSYFSSRGPTGDGRMKPDIVAPGEKIRSAIPGKKMLIMDGTSMAAPHVSGVCALLMGRYPELVGEPQRIKQILMSTATDLGRERHFQGAGLVDALRALQSV